MQKPPVKLMRAALNLIEELDTIKSDCTEAFDSSSQAAAENTVAIRSGINAKVDLVSIPGVRLHLHLKLYAAREDLLSCIYLIGSNAELTLMNSIQALARSAMEASATCLWLCSNKITWEERLRRHSQLHLKSAYTCLKEEGIDPNNPPDRSTIGEDIILTMEECNTIINWVKGRGWTCKRGRNRESTISRWVGELPSYSDLMKEAATIIPVSPEHLRSIYSMYSRSVHTDPVTVAGGSTEEDERARRSIAMAATASALMFYAVAWKLLASWCSVPYPEDAISHHIAELGQYE